MNSLRKFHPDLQTCELEDRVLPVINTLGVIVLTADAPLLLILKPGIANAVGAPKSATIPSSLSMTSLDGLFNTQFGNIAGLATTKMDGSSGGPAVAFDNGSVASDLAAQDIPLVTRNTIANDAPNPSPRIGRLSEDQSPILPRGQVYRGGFPVIAPEPPSRATPAVTPIQYPSWIPVTRVHSTDSFLRS
jgi:hypothetical protein